MNTEWHSSGALINQLIKSGDVMTWKYMLSTLLALCEGNLPVPRGLL